MSYFHYVANLVVNLFQKSRDVQLRINFYNTDNVYFCLLLHILGDFILCLYDEYRMFLWQTKKKYYVFICCSDSVLYDSDKLVLRM